MQRKRPSLTDRDPVKRRRAMAPSQDAVPDDANTSTTGPTSVLTSPVGRVGSPGTMHPSLSASINKSFASSPRQPRSTPAGLEALSQVQSHLADQSYDENMTSLSNPPRSGRASPPGFLHIPKMPPLAQIALSAMEYLPTPLLVLSSLKNVIFANDAMGKLLGLEMIPGAAEAQQQGTNVTDKLIGQSLGQIGVDLIQDGQPVWVNWERFLDGLTKRSAERLTSSHATGQIEVNEDLKSLAREASMEPASFDDDSQSPTPKRKRPGWDEEMDGQALDRSFVQDTVVDVLLSSQYIGSAMSSRDSKTLLPYGHVQARMVISIWSIDGQPFYSLAFSAASPSSAAPASKSQLRMTARSQAASTSPSSAGSLRAVLSGPKCTHCGHLDPNTPPPRTSPSEQPLSIAPFPLSSTTSTPSALQRTFKLKDAMINGMQIPKFAMWKDESLIVPNKAAEVIMRRHTDPTSDETLSPVARFPAYTEDFSRRLEEDEVPIVMLCRTQKPFKSMKVGFMDRKGKQIVYDISGECLYDDNGDFIGGMTALKDVTEFTEKIREQSFRNEQQFELICDCMPQIAWTTTPGGGHDWFSKRWYEYTGLTEEQSLGEQWANVFHPDDMPETEKRWRHSLATGDEYVTEYRARSAVGEWRWMLGRALPLKHPKTGEILKWFGTCTDIHDLVQARQEQKRTHEQLINVIEHAKVTVWSIDRQKNLTFLEGPLHSSPDSDRSKKDLIGLRIGEAFAGPYDMSKYEAPIDKIIAGVLGEHVIEHHVSGSHRWYRTRFVPIRGKKRNNGRVDEKYVDGVVGVSQDVSEIKMREQELHNTEKENLRLLGAETAAKEASRLKSQFLANMSHEIRTPIAGVIGMAELMVDTDLNEDQRELAENIQRSANGLLTVINDILDLSKVESGRLEIESVQFNLSLVLKDVGKMMSFAAGQKGINFDEDFEFASREDIILIGDPNRCRQILTNLLTNSIKFTQDGSVKLAAWKGKETSDTLSVTFCVEDTGEGIEEEVKKKLFKPFTQADSSTARRFGGTGLGLTICKNLVDLMKGTIKLDSTLGQGTKAQFTIPFTKPQLTDRNKPLVDLGFMPDRFSNELSMSARGSSDHGTPPHTPSDPMKPASFAKRISTASSLNDPSAIMPPQERQSVHILVVEDNKVNQQIATRTIKKLGFSVHAVDNGKQALEYLLKSSNPEVALGASASSVVAKIPGQSMRTPNVILMDVQMPVLDGYRATHQIRHHDPFKNLPGMSNVPIVAMTASAIQGDKERCQRAGMDDYLSKPVKSTILEQMLVKWAMKNKKALSAQSSNEANNAPSKVTTSEHDSNCTETDILLSTIPPFNQPAHSHLSPQQNRRSRLAASPSFPDVMSPPPETEGDRGLRRQAAEEKASALRDDKLVSAAESDDDVKRPRLARGKPSEQFRSAMKTEALTEENLGNMNRERESSASYESETTQHRLSPKALKPVDDDVRPVVKGDSLAVDVQMQEDSIPERPDGLSQLHNHESGSSGDSLHTNAEFVKVARETPSDAQGGSSSKAASLTSHGDPKERLKAVRINSGTSDKTVTAKK